MAFDPVLAERVRDFLAPIGAAREVRMFGGVAFMLQGYMAVCVRGEDVYVRLGNEGSAAAVAAGEAEPFYPSGKRAIGLVTVPEASGLDDDDLQRWVERGAGFVRTLPPKEIR